VDLLVSISSVGLERDLAFRTRLLDAAWGGLTSLSVAGGPLARQLEEAGAGRQVAATAPAVADALTQMLGADAAEKEKMAAAARRFAAARAWSLVAAPLAAWCREARVDPGRLPLPPPESQPLWRRLRKKVAGER
jgi:hypothetical protein